MGQGWEEEVWRNVMFEFVFCCQVVQVACIEGTCQKETRKESVKFESDLLWVPTHRHDNTLRAKIPAGPKICLHWWPELHQ